MIIYVKYEHNDIIIIKNMYILNRNNYICSMTTIRDRVNAHLPIVLQVLSTASLIVIALSAICGGVAARYRRQTPVPS